MEFKYLKPEDCKTVASFIAMKDYFERINRECQDALDAEGYSNNRIKTRNYWDEVFNQILPSHPDFEKAKIKAEKLEAFRVGIHPEDWDEQTEEKLLLVESRYSYFPEDKGFFELFQRVRKAKSNLSDAEIKELCTKTVQKLAERQAWHEKIDAFYKGNILNDVDVNPSEAEKCN